MSDESSQPLPDPTSDSAPKGAEVVSKPPSDSGLEPELLERVEAAARGVAVSVVKHEMHSGPMPPPRQLKEYDEALPGTALAIRDEFQANGRHQRECEKRALEAAIDNDRANRNVAERLVWGSMIAALTLALTGHENAAIAFAAPTIAAVIGGFLRKKQQKKPALPSSDEE